MPWNNEESFAGDTFSPRNPLDDGGGGVGGGDKRRGPGRPRKYHDAEQKRIASKIQAQIRNERKKQEQRLFPFATSLSTSLSSSSRVGSKLAPGEKRSRGRPPIYPNEEERKRGTKLKARLRYLKTKQEKAERQKNPDYFRWKDQQNHTMQLYAAQRLLLPPSTKLTPTPISRHHHHHPEETQETQEPQDDPPLPLALAHSLAPAVAPLVTSESVMAAAARAQNARQWTANSVLKPVLGTIPGLFHPQ